MKEKTERSLATPFKEESIPGTPYCRVYGHSLWLNAYNNLVTIGIGGGKAWPPGFDRNTMQGALSGDPSVRTNTDRGGCIMSLSFLPSTVRFFSRIPGASSQTRGTLLSRSIGDAIYAAASILACQFVGKCLDGRWGKYGDVSAHFHEKNARSTPGASTAGIWSSQFSIIPRNRERIPLLDAAGRRNSGWRTRSRRKKRIFRRI